MAIVRKKQKSPRTSVRVLANQLDGAPSFFDGIARIFDFGNVLTPYYTLPLEKGDPDRIALYSDWMALQGDARQAFYQTVNHA
jgi:hypothetical protein